jgi:alkylation response protein AidB-like acyl-CoA dehydrogenase
MKAHLPLNRDQEGLRELARQFLRKKSPIDVVRRSADLPSGYEEAVWSQLSGQLGLQAMAIPEEYGGAGFGYQEFGIAFEETGRALYCGPLFATAALAVPTVLAIDDEAAKKALLPDLASGETTATLAVTEVGGQADDLLCADRTTATHRPNGWVVSGHKTHVVDGHTADTILVSARTDDGLSLFAIDAAEQGVQRRKVPTLDQTRVMADLDFTDVPARLIGRSGAAESALVKGRQLALVALASEQAGGAAHCLEMSMSYAQTRQQFGRAIGSFQAIKHTLAEMFVDEQSARTAAQYAAYAATADSEEFPRMAAVAKTVCSEAFYRIAAATIQIHGGIGFTWEHDSHLYYKRAEASRLFAGTPTQHRAAIADMLAI